MEVLRHCGRPMMQVGRGLWQCTECGHTEVEKPA